MILKDKSLLVSVLLFIILILTVNLVNFHIPSTLIIAVKCQAGDVYKLYYDIGNGYNEIDSIKVPIKKSDDFLLVRFKLPLKEVKRIEIDLGNQLGTTEIKKISLQNINKEYSWALSNIVRDFQPIQNAINFRIENDVLIFEKMNRNLYLEINGNFNNVFSSISLISKPYLYTTSFLISLIVFLISKYGMKIKVHLIKYLEEMRKNFSKSSGTLFSRILVNKKWLNFYAFISLIIISFLFVLYLYEISHKTISKEDPKLLIGSLPECYVVTLLIVFIVLLLYYLFRFKAIYFIIFFAGALYIFLNGYFAPIDEESHFAYVHHIVKNHNLPTLYVRVSDEILSMGGKLSSTPSKEDAAEIYEAFQPPLYYLLASILMILTPGKIVVKFYVLRFLGLLCVLVSIYLFKKTYQLLKEKGIVKGDDFLFFSIVSLFTLTPGFLLRMTTLSNLHLLIPLACLFFYVLIKLSFLEVLKFRDVVLLSLLSDALILTQFTSIFIPIVIVVFFIIKRQSKNLLTYFILVFVIISPWFIYNLHQYGYLTANTMAKGMQQHIINPNYDKYDLFFIFNGLPYLFATFWNPQEAMLNPPVIMTLNFISVCIIFIILYFIYYLIRNLNKLCNASFKNIVFIITFTILLNFGLLFYITITQSWSVLLGRYLYISIGLFIFFVYLFIEKNVERYRKTVPLLFLFSTVFLYSNFLVQLLLVK